MTKYIIIKADTNDGDYITEKNKITDAQIDFYKLIIEIIKKHHGDWHTGDQGDIEEDYAEEIEKGIVNLNDLESFSEFVPFGEYGTHTIESIEILEVANEYKLL